MLFALVAAAHLHVALAPIPSAVLQSQAPLIGRWDLVMETPGRHKAAWLEVRHSGRSMLVGAFVNMVGSARPVARIDYREGDFKFSLPPQWNDAEGENTVVGRLKGDSITGTISYANGQKQAFRGARAPSLVRTAPPAWELPTTLFNGRDLTGWKALGEGTNQWDVANGVLRNKAAGTDLVTERQFTDFKLHLEFRFPTGSNSGVYLRGRYEVQVEDTQGNEAKIDGLGAVYGHLIPNELASLGPDKWQSYDITLIGRRVTIVLNGKTIIADQVIPGITGGALDSDEGKPGPIFLQGDHGPVEYRNIVITAAK